MGFYTIITFVPNIFERTRMQILRQVRDINYLKWNFSFNFSQTNPFGTFFPCTHLPHTCIVPPLGTTMLMLGGGGML
jgi:hypothetical protein